MTKGDFVGPVPARGWKSPFYVLKKFCDFPMEAEICDIIKSSLPGVLHPWVKIGIRQHGETVTLTAPDGTTKTATITIESTGFMLIVR